MTGRRRPAVDPCGATILVLAKEPVAGRVKTRLCPPCTPEEAAELAAAALEDTLDAVSVTPAARRVLVLDGAPGEWCPSGVEVVAQAEGGLDARLEAAFSLVDGPALLIGMDTPQVSPSLLAASMAPLTAAGAGRRTAVLGRALDGGWWAAGFARRPRPGAFAGVPMSTDITGAAQRRRFVDLGYEVVDLPRLRDVDHADDLVAVAASMDAGRFPDAVRALGVTADG